MTLADLNKRVLRKYTKILNISIKFVPGKQTKSFHELLTMYRFYQSILDQVQKDLQNYFNNAEE